MSKIYNIISKHFKKEKIALKCDNNEISYIDLNKKINEISNYIPHNTLCIIDLNKNINYIIALLACLKNNNAFIPIDNQWPDERKFSIRKSFKKPFIINNETFSKKETPENDYDKNNENLAYIIFTSGSTGKPKGIKIKEKAIINIIEQQIKIFNINEKSIFLWILSQGFDASLSDIFTTLFSGGTLSFSERNLKEIIEKNSLENILNQSKATHSDIPPSLLKFINYDNLFFLKHIIIGGEVADKNTILNFLDKNIYIYNVYGPTETTICSSIIKCDKNFKQNSIGYPIKNIKYQLINKDNKIISTPFEKGELIISGIGLCKGHLNKKLDLEKFITINNNKFYKTGDLVHFNKEKEWFFDGRVDRQFKINGQLICPEEIEITINSIQGIISSSVFFKDNILTAFIENKKNISKKSIIIYLEKYLPHYMIPKKYIMTKNIKRNNNEKIDHKHFKYIELIKKHKKYLFYKKAFEKVLKQKIDDPTLTFEELGGTSLLMLELILELEKYNIHISVQKMHNLNSIEKLINEEENNYNQFKEKKHLVKFLPKINNALTTNLKKTLNEKNILITGANGFLGNHLLLKLKEYYPDAHFYCLIRSNNVENATKKIKKSLNENFLLIDDWTNITIINGDVSKEYFSLEKNFYLKLSEKITHIFHCSAEVNNIKKFEELYENNVIATKNIVDFSLKNFIKNLYYMSTLSVFVSSNHLKKSFYEKKINIDNYQLNTGYAQSKWITEYYIQYFYSHKNIKTFRLGLLTPHSTNPVFKKNQFITHVFENILQINELPIEAQYLSMDFTPIDFAVEQIIDNLNSSKNIIHITTEEKIFIQDIIQKKTQWIPFKKWTKKYNLHPLNLYLYEIHNQYPEFNIFETTRVENFGTEKKPFNKEEIIVKYIEQFKKKDKND